MTTLAFCWFCSTEIVSLAELVSLWAGCEHFGDAHKSCYLEATPWEIAKRRAGIDDEPST